MATKNSTGTSARVDHPGTAPLPVLAVEAMRRLGLALIPPLMEFPTGSGATVTVHAGGGEGAPYSWQCSAGHSGSHAYASLPFCRDDAKAHAAECPGAAAPLPTPAEIAARFRQASAHCRELSKACMARLDRGGEFGDLVDALADARDEMGHCRCQLEKAGRLDLIEAAS